MGGGEISVCSNTKNQGLSSRSNCYATDVQERVTPTERNGETAGMNGQGVAWRKEMLYIGFVTCASIRLINMP